MGLLTQVYINSSDFALATAVFTDQALTTLAPDGFYSMQGIVREQVSGVLGKSFLCEACEPNCDANEIIYILDQKGEYTYNVYLGDTFGAVRIHVDTLSGCVGFSAEHANTVHNGIHTKNLGLLETSSSNGVTYIGDNSAFTTSGGPISNYNFEGGEFVDDGTVVSITPFAGGNLTNATYHGGGTITFGKISSTDNLCEITVRAPFDNSSASFRVECVGNLPAFDSSQTPETSSSNACSDSATGLFYCSVINGTVSQGGDTMSSVAIGDLVFNDPYAITPATDGWYGINQGAMEITNGVITDISDCAE